MISIILSTIAIIISILSISFQIYSWKVNKKDKFNLELIKLLDNIFEKYKHLNYDLNSILETDKNIENYTIKFYEDYNKYLSEIINSLKINNQFLLEKIICNKCNKIYKFKELFNFLDEWKFKNIHNFDIISILLSNKTTHSKTIAIFDEHFKIFFNLKNKKLSTLSCPLCLRNELL